MPTQAEMLPFFFEVFLPKGRNQGVLALQRFGNFGIREIFSTHFKVFAQRHPDFSVRINPIVHPEQLRLLTKGGVVRRLVFRRFVLPHDIADRLGSTDPNDAYDEYSIVIKRDTNLPLFQKVLKKLSQRDDRPLILQPPGDFQPDRTLIEISLNNRTRTIDISNLSKIRAYFDVTGEIVKDANGHPTYSSIKKACHDVVTDIWNSMN